VPLFLSALLVVRGLPALLSRPTAGSRRTIVAALLQATSLPFIVAATRVGMERGKLNAATGAAFVAAGLLSVPLFPLGAVTILRGGSGETAPAASSLAAGSPRGSASGVEPEMG
jgi:hypothetical protein